MGIDGPRIDQAVVLPNVAQQLLAGLHPAPALRQHGQQLEFGGRQLDLLAAPAYQVPGRVNQQLTPDSTTYDNQSWQSLGAYQFTSGKLTAHPMRDFVAAVSVGIVAGEIVLDLDYDEDSSCDTDMNVVMTGGGGLVEVQGTAEGEPFSRSQLDSLIDLAADGIRSIIHAQRQAIADPQS